MGEIASPPSSQPPKRHPHRRRPRLLRPKLDFIVCAGAGFKAGSTFWRPACMRLFIGPATPCASIATLKGRFNILAYAAEELIAELGAAFLCAHLGSPESSSTPTHRFMIHLLKSDAERFFAASHASKRRLSALILRGCTWPNSPTSGLFFWVTIKSGRTLGGRHDKPSLWSTETRYPVRD